MSVGKGWLPPLPDDEVEIVAKDLLKGLLDKVWEKMKNNHNNSLPEIPDS